MRVQLAEGEQSEEQQEVQQIPLSVLKLQFYSVRIHYLDLIGGGPPRPRKNSGLLTQKLLAASNGDLYTAM